MKEQKTTFETLKSENEDVDITEVIINLTSAKLTYEAALMATGKIAQTTPIPGSKHSSTLVFTRTV